MTIFNHPLTSEQRAEVDKFLPALRVGNLAQLVPLFLDPVRVANLGMKPVPAQALDHLRRVPISDLARLAPWDHVFLDLWNACADYVENELKHEKANVFLGAKVTVLFLSVQNRLLQEIKQAGSSPEAP